RSDTQHLAVVVCDARRPVVRLFLTARCRVEADAAQRDCDCRRGICGIDGHRRADDARRGRSNGRRALLDGARGQRGPEGFVVNLRKMRGHGQGPEVVDIKGYVCEKRAAGTAACNEPDGFVGTTEIRAVKTRRLSRIVRAAVIEYARKTID